MNFIKLTPVLVLLFASTSCKKSYTCQCQTSGSVSATYNLNETKAKAKSICDKHNAEVNKIPWSESFCELK
jgi:hypothetical protein